MSIYSHQAGSIGVTQPGKIHISPTSHALLQTFPGFHCEKRGLVTVKVALLIFLL